MCVRLLMAIALYLASMAAARSQTTDSIIVVPNYGIVLPRTATVIPHVQLQRSLKMSPSADGDWCTRCNCCRQVNDMPGLRRLLTARGLRDGDIDRSYEVDLKKYEETYGAR